MDLSRLAHPDIVDGLISELPREQIAKCITMAKDAFLEKQPTPLELAEFLRRLDSAAGYVRRELHTRRSRHV